MCALQVTELQGVRLKRLSCGAQHTLFLSSQGGVWACGSGGCGRLGLGLGLGGRAGSLLPRQVPGLSGTVVVQVSAGAWHSAFVDEAGGVFMCGSDESGQLGLNGPAMSASKVSAPPKLVQQRGAVVLGTSCGGEHTVFVLKAIVDPADDVRADETEAAAKLVQRLVRGGATRKSISEGPNRPKPRLPGTHTELQREAAATVLQASARSRAVRRRRTIEARRGSSVWSGLRSRFVAALASSPFEEAAKEAGGREAKSKSDW